MTLDEPRRPDPDALLAEASKAGRGRLKVFLGMAPGVGKTYEMLCQAGRIAKARGAPVDVVRNLIADHVEEPFLGFIGQPHVNVLMTNRALDAALPKGQPKPA